MSKKKKKLDLDQSSEPLGNLFEALDALSGADLPAGPEHVPTAPQSESTNETKPGRGHEVILRRETAGRAGKAVIVVTRFPETMADDELESLAALLKKQCGCGGTVKNREIEIQGERAQKVADILRGQGFRVRGLGVR